jgi:uncharacterized short protein YbdD (DUF466 family)
MSGLRRLSIFSLLFLVSCRTHPDAASSRFSIRLVHPRDHVLKHYKISEDAIEVSGYKLMWPHPEANTNMVSAPSWVSEKSLMSRQHLRDARVMEKAAIMVMSEEQYHEFVSRMQTVNPDAELVSYRQYLARIENLAADIQLDFTEEGRNRLAQLTRRHRMRRIAITVDDHVLAAPFIHETISSGSLVLSSGFSREQAKSLVHRLLKK